MLSLKIEMMIVEVKDKNIEIDTEIFQNILALPGFKAPRLFPTKLEVAKDIPRGNMYSRERMFIMITLAPS